ncbi:hypothetical protein [Flavobacterium sp. 3HN19-14]|uniref:hypothetical protein n=1 Tax=Flavobacterium sp. 3HN19-14 TaxID=3448133 RepID=UPI003EDFF862
MKSRIILLLCCTPFLMATTCEDEGNNKDCDGAAVAGLNISIHPGNTDAPISADGITVVITDETFSETLTHNETSLVFSGAYERPGNYIITVTKENYQTYISPIIAVGKLGCHVTTEHIDVTLLPE